VYCHVGNHGRCFVRTVQSDTTDARPESRKRQQSPSVHPVPGRHFDKHWTRRLAPEVITALLETSLPSPYWPLSPIIPLLDVIDGNLKLILGLIWTLIRWVLLPFPSWQRTGWLIFLFLLILRSVRFTIADISEEGVNAKEGRSLTVSLLPLAFGSFSILSNCSSQVSYYGVSAKHVVTNQSMWQISAVVGKMD
jgi:hypothetical protein